MSRDRERQAIAQVACPACEAAAGAPCRDEWGAPIVRPGRPYVHTERRQEMQAQRAASDALDADIVFSDQAEGQAGQRHTYVLLAPLTARGRAALPDGPTRVEHADVRHTLARLRGQVLLIRREGE